MYKYIFGSVPSRRLGMSLGVDLVPKKVCSLDYVYCEVGKTTKLTLERKEYIKHTTIIEELTHYFKNNPDSVQLNTLDRPGTIPNLRGATRKELQRVVDFWKLDNVELISASIERKSIQSYRNDIETTIIETISRRPCTLDDLTQILGLHINEINKYLDVLEADEKIETIQQERGLFYQKKDRNQLCIMMINR